MQKRSRAGYQFKEPVYTATETGLTKATKKLWKEKPCSYEFKEVDPDLRIDLFQKNRIYALIRSTSTYYHKD